MQKYEDYYKRSSLKKLLFFLLGWIAIIAKALPKKKGLYAFGSMNGFSVSDNSKYLFLNSEPSKTNYFITKNKEILSSALSPGVYPVYAYSLKGIAIQLFAEKTYFSHGIYDFVPVLIWGSQKHNLWHGVPCKEIGPEADWKQSSEFSKRIKTLFYRVHGYLYYMSCDYIYCPFEDRVHDYTRYFSVSKPKVVVSKQPRNHYAKKNNISRNVLYAPTFRGGKFPGFSYQEFFRTCGLYDVDLQHFLSSNDIKLVLRPHPIDLIEISKIPLPHNVILDESADLYESLTSYEIVITDYSSICLDCEEIGISYYFIAPDLDQYRSLVGLSGSISERMTSRLLHKLSELQSLYSPAST
jgi:CDP-glycerol glycerophosphotransferase (TagB/SpsB family)